MSFNTSTLGKGQCPEPFLEEDLFPTSGGFVDGRFCSTLLGPSCCLPCPQTEWLYPDNFDTLTRSASWVSVPGMACSVFLLASFALLPVDKTRRHYLSVCLSVAIVLLQMGFIIPLAAKPDKCYNAITPNDMKSSRTCALSGAFLLAGGWSAVMWVFLRAAALHLQICWQFVIGKTFMWGAIASGWGIPAIALTIALVFSGVSFRFGDTCHINHTNSLADFWIPLLVFATVTVIIQFATFGYCIRVYLASLADASSATEGSSGDPSYTYSVRATVTPRQAYRRVRRVIELQWRGIAIVLLIIGDVIFFAVIFVFLDDTETTILRNPLKAAQWLECIVENSGQKQPCLSLAKPLIVNEATVMAVLILLSMNGIWCLVLLGRVSMVRGWWEKISGKVEPSNEFDSVDVSRFKDPGSYEMLGHDSGKTPEPLVTATITPISPSLESGRVRSDYFGREARYESPSQSFSAPQPPRNQTPSWGPIASHPSPQYIDPLSMNKV